MVVAVLSQLLLEVGRVVVLEADQLGARQLGPGRSAVVDEVVVENDVLGTDDGGDRRNVGGVAADEGQADSVP